MVVSQDGYVSSDGRRRLVIARPAKPPYDTAFSRALFDRLQTIARERATTARPDSDDDRPPLDVQFAGGHRIGLEAEAVVKRESIVNGVGSLALILPLLLVLFRSLRLVAIGALPSALSFLIVLGALGFAGATLSAAAAGASAMLFGLGVDGVVLLYLTHRLALQETGNASAAIRGISAPAASMVLGMWTTAATFLGLLVVDFPSLEQLGLLIGASMFVCGIATLILVPASLPAQAPAQPPRSFTLPRFAAAVRSHARLVLAGAALLTIVLGYGATTLRVNPTLDRLRSVTEGARVLEEVTETFALPSDVIAILQTGADLDRLLDDNAAFVVDARSAIPSLSLQAPGGAVAFGANTAGARAAGARRHRRPWVGCGPTSNARQPRQGFCRARSIPSSNVSTESPPPSPSLTTGSPRIGSMTSSAGSSCATVTRGHWPHTRFPKPLKSGRPCAASSMHVATAW